MTDMTSEQGSHARRICRPGVIVKHFKTEVWAVDGVSPALKGYYEVLAVAMHTETNEMMVVYKPIDGTQNIYVRPLEMFISKVDKEKYPFIHQKWRLQYVAEAKDIVDTLTIGKLEEMCAYD